MDKTKMFMMLTAMLSIVCFNFNKILDSILSFVFENLYDDSILTYGPYMKSKPIIIETVMIDKKIYTNKTTLLLNWKWDFDIMGFLTSDILLLKPNATIMVMQYKKKYTDSLFHTIMIDFENNTITENSETKDIMFGEVYLFS
jgi:hypothetical protein